MDLVDQLFGAGHHVEPAARAWRLADDDRTVGFDIGEGITVAREIGHIFLARPAEAAAGHRRGAFEQMAGGGALRDFRQIVIGPAEFVQHRREKQRRIGHAPGQNNRRAGVERLTDDVGAEISVGGDHLRQDRFQRLAVFDEFETALMLDDARDIVAEHDRDRHVAEAEIGSLLARRARAAERIGGAHVADDADALLECRSAAPCAAARAATANSRGSGLCCAPDSRVTLCVRQDTRTPGSRCRRARRAQAPAACDRPTCRRRRRREWSPAMPLDVPRAGFSGVWPRLSSRPCMRRL